MVHPTALVQTERVGPGTRIWGFTHVQAGASIGRDCNIGSHCYVEAGAVLGDCVTVKNGNAIWAGVTLDDGVFVAPGVVFTNDRHPRSPRLGVTGSRYDDDSSWLTPTRVGRGATVGAGAVVVAGVTIGEFALVGAGALVIRDVAPHALVYGSPAERRAWVCRCAQRLEPCHGGREVCPQCGVSYVLDRADRPPSFGSPA